MVLCSAVSSPWTAQSEALYTFPPLTDLFIPTPFSASPGSIVAMQQLRATTKSLRFPPLSIARYSFIQLSRQGRQCRERKCPIFETVAKGGFEPGLTRLRVQHSTTELPDSTALGKCSHNNLQNIHIVLFIFILLYSSHDSSDHFAQFIFTSCEC